MTLPLHTPPTQLCLLRLSAIGDVCHTLPIVRTIQDAWPQTQITWIIGSGEYQLLKGIEGVEFIIFDKSKRWHAYLELARSLRGRRFDALLHMQMSLRSSLASLLVRSPIRLGFDRARAKDLQWLFTNHAIPPHTNQHVMESLFGFSAALGIEQQLLQWDIPIPDHERLAALAQLPNQLPFCIISPCSSMAYRNWLPERYAEVADTIQRSYGLQVVLTGGRSALEQQMGQQIADRVTRPIINLIGKSSLKQLLALLAQAHFIVSPDSGPAHMGTAVATPVVGLYACTNPDRARPYLSAQWVVNRYPEALAHCYGNKASTQPWGTRVRGSHAMEAITVADVTTTIQRLMQQHPINETR